MHEGLMLTLSIVHSAFYMLHFHAKACLLRLLPASFHCPNLGVHGHSGQTTGTARFVGSSAFSYNAGGFGYGRSPAGPAANDSGCTGRPLAAAGHGWADCASLDDVFFSRPHRQCIGLFGGFGHEFALGECARTTVAASAGATCGGGVGGRWCWPGST